MKRGESIVLGEKNAAELAQYMRTTTNFAAIDPDDRQAEQTSLQETGRWLDSVDFGVDNDTRDQTVETERTVFKKYLGRLSIVAPSYYDTIEQIADSCPEMNEKCRITVNMPASFEAATIGTALGHMLLRKNDGKTELAQLQSTGEVLDPQTYEVFICSNRAKGTASDGTNTAIHDFAERHKSVVNIMAVDVELDGSIANNGMARRLLHDVTVMRSLNRDNQAGKHFIAAEDADIDGYDPDALDSYIKYLDTHPDKSAVRMRTERNPIVLKEVPHVLIKHRFMTQLITILRSAPFRASVNPNYNFRFNRKVPSGYGTAFNTSDLIRAGGFPISGSGTDLYLGEQLAVMRGTRMDGRVLPAGNTVGAVASTVVASPRREIVAYLNNVAMYDNGNFTNRATQDITRQPIDNLIEQASNRNFNDSRQWLQDQMEQGLNRIVATAPSGEISDHSLRLLMTMIGFEKSDYLFEYSDGKLRLRVQSWDTVEYLSSRYKPSSRIQRAMHV